MTVKLPYSLIVKNSSPIRSIHACGSRHLGGAEAFFTRLLRGLNDREYPSMGVVRSGTPLQDELGDVPVIGTGMRNGLDVFTVRRIRELVRRHRPAVVQTYLGRASRLTRIPKQSETLHVARLGGFYRANAYRHADAWVGNTRGICDHLIGLGFPRGRVFHIGNFVADSAPEGAPEDVRATLGISPESTLIFALGRFVEKKGFVDLLQAFSQLRSIEPERPMVLVIAGDGPDRSVLEQKARQLDIAEHVRWPGWIQHPGAYFRAADIFVCPSRHEPLGNVILESWFHGAPLVSTRSLGAEELVTDNQDGLLTPVADPEGLAHRVLDLLHADAAHVEALVEAGRRTVEQSHSVGAVVDAYLELYAHLAELGRAR